MTRRFPAPAGLGADRRGVVATEFAIALPVLILLFVGSFQMSDAVFAYSKVTKTARTIADLTSQYTAVTTADLDSVLNASQQVLAPYKITDTKLVISQVTINNAGNATVSWSQGKNTGGYIVGSTFYVPPTYKQPNTTILVADVQYSYVPLFATSYFGTVVMKEQVTMYPRKSTTISKS